MELHTQQVAGEAERGEQQSGAPRDIAEGALFLDELLLALRKASRLGLAGGSFGRPRSVREATAAVAGAVQDMQTDAAGLDKVLGVSALPSGREEACSQCEGDFNRMPHRQRRRSSGWQRRQGRQHGCASARRRPWAARSRSRGTGRR